MGALTGKVSWFGGANDRMNTGTALGLPDTARGLAVYNQKTLGGYWRVHWPNGRVTVERQIDIGPAPYTGRKIDFTSAAIRANGYTEQNFPTDAKMTIEYLGKKKPSAQTSGGGLGGGAAPMARKGLDARQQALLSIAGKLGSSPFDRGGGTAPRSNPLYSLLARRADLPSQAKSATPSPSQPAGAPVDGQFSFAAGTPALTHPSIRKALAQIAGQYGHALTVGTTTNHSKYTTSGNVSDHWTGNAADIPASGAALTRMGQAALIALGKPASWARKQQGGVFNIDRGGKRYQILFNTNTGGNHYNHLHVGVR